MLQTELDTNLRLCTRNSLSDLEHVEESELDNVEESNDELTLNMPADEHSRPTMMKPGGNRNSLPASMADSTSPLSSASTPTSGPGPSGMFKLLRQMSSAKDLLKLAAPQGNAKSKADGRSEFARLYSDTFTKISAERTYRKISAEHKHSKSEACLATKISADRTYRKISDEHKHSKSEGSIAKCREISVDRCRSEISSGTRLSYGNLAVHIQSEYASEQHLVVDRPLVDRSCSEAYSDCSD